MLISKYFYADMVLHSSTVFIDVAKIHVPALMYNTAVKLNIAYGLCSMPGTK